MLKLKVRLKLVLVLELGLGLGLCFTVVSAFAHCHISHIPHDRLSSEKIVIFAQRIPHLVYTKNIRKYEIASAPVTLSTLYGSLWII